MVILGKCEWDLAFTLGCGKEVRICERTWYLRIALELQVYFRVGRVSEMLVFERMHAELRPFDFHRARIPGGWILVMQYGGTSDGRLCFVPDTDHKWDGSSLTVGARNLRKFPGSSGSFCR